MAHPAFTGILAELPRQRQKFEEDVDAAGREVSELARQISGALGDASINELKRAIVREFVARLYIR